MFDLYYSITCSLLVYHLKCICYNSLFVFSTPATHFSLVKFNPLLVLKYNDHVFVTANHSWTLLAPLCQLIGGSTVALAFFVANWVLGDTHTEHIQIVVWIEIEEQWQLLLLLIATKLLSLGSALHPVYQCIGYCAGFLHFEL